jgi:flagellar hook-length control protein FliK
MFASLNLQLTALELPDETLKTMTKLLPENGTKPQGGFADLLSLRLADASAESLTGGELLPPAGSQLPLAADPEISQLSAEAVSADDVMPELPEIDVALQLLADDTDLAVEAEVPYGTQLEILTVAEPAPVAAAAAAVATATRAVPVTGQPAVVGNAANLLAEMPGSAAPTPVLTQPVPATPDQMTPLTMAAQRGDVAVDGNAARDRVAINVAQPAAVQPDLDRTVAPNADTQRAVPIPPELQRRPELTASQRADAIAQAVTELVRPRPVVNQVVQTLQAQLNAQQGTIFQGPLAAPAPTAVTEVTYSAAAQQATTDLIGTPVRDASWGDRLGERVMMMAGSQLKTAEIRLTPAEMGPLRVQVNVDDGAAHVTFHAQHAVTREAIEQALPRLREMLAESGLSLGNAHVGGEGVAEGNRDGQGETAFAGQAGAELTDSVSADRPETTRTRLTGSGLVDTFA